jgi:hypothetical protein
MSLEASSTTPECICLAVRQAARHVTQFYISAWRRAGFARRSSRCLRSAAARSADDERPCRRNADGSHHARAEHPAARPGRAHPDRAGSLGPPQQASSRDPVRRAAPRRGRQGLDGSGSSIRIRVRQHPHVGTARAAGRGAATQLGPEDRLANATRIYPNRFEACRQVCGACTILIDTPATRSCITTLDSVGHATITTIKALGGLIEVTRRRSVRCYREFKQVIVRTPDKQSRRHSEELSLRAAPSGSAATPPGCGIPDL